MVNKTSMPLVIESQTIKPQSNDYLGLQTSDMTLKIPGYSKHYLDVSTIGLSGVLSFELESKEEVHRDMLPQRDYVPQRLECGVMIEQGPTPFNKTTIVTVVPRYIIVNQLEGSLVVKQRCHGSKQLLLKEQAQSYNFQTRGERMIMIRQVHKEEDARLALGGKLFEDLGSDDHFWSSPFSIDDIDDFQVSFPTDAASEEADWYLPNS